MFNTISESKTVLTLVMHINIRRLGYHHDHCSKPYRNKSLTHNNFAMKNTSTYVFYQKENTFLYSMSTPNIDVKQALAIRSIWHLVVAQHCQGSSVIFQVQNTKDKFYYSERARGVDSDWRIQKDILYITLNAFFNILKSQLNGCQILDNIFQMCFTESKISYFDSTST